MIYILEIPHQRRPACWSRDTHAEIVDAINAVAERTGERFDDFGAALDWLASDLYALRVYEGDAEAVAALGEYQGHQSEAAEAVLRDELAFYDALHACGITYAAADLAMAMWQEQIGAGIAAPGEEVDEAGLKDWLYNRTYTWPWRILERAAAGDVAALAEVREEAGLPVLV